MSARRDPAHEKILLGAATKSLRELSEYYRNVQLSGPAKLAGKAISLLHFIKRVG